MKNNARYFAMNDAISCFVESKTVFIISNERIKKNGEIGRYYTIFPTFKEFLKQREMYPHCHEIFLDHQNNKPNIAGRLVFDFDITQVNHENDNVNKKIIVPITFKDQIEDTILEVLEKYFNNIDMECLKFVWSTSNNTKKFSKHLTVKNLYFDNWHLLCRIFYQLFSIVWDEKYVWIKSKDLIDFQIVRKHASLRMVGSKKIKGNPLVLDDPKYNLTDSLIRIYYKNQRLKEQLITIDNINTGVFENVLEEPRSDTTMQIKIMDVTFGKISEPRFETPVYQKAYELYYMIQPGVFTMGKISDNILSLMRDKSNCTKVKANCILSGKLHENENAFLIIKKKEDIYTIHFGCNRFCHYMKSVYIGSLRVDNLTIIIDSNFNPSIKKTRKKKKPKMINL